MGERAAMLSLAEAIAATDARWEGPAPTRDFTGVGTDSRAIRPGALFVCLRGERFDGHQFAHEVASAGAGGLVVAADWAGALGADIPVLRVPDTLVAYGQLARAWRRRLGLPLIAITGSSGKTSTKEMVAAYLGRWWPVAKTQANHNNEVGVPLTLLAIAAHHRAAIVEMGMRGPGEIGYLARVAEPDIGVITNIGVAHIGRLGSQSAIAEAKSELWREMPAGGLAIYPLADPLAREKAVAWGGRQLSFGDDDPAADLVATDVTPVGEGQAFAVRWRAGLGPEAAPLAAGQAHVTLPLWGDHHRANALAAIACGLALGLVPEASIAIAPETLAGRSSVFEAHGVTIIDDSYNANPASMRAALKAFAEAPSIGRRFAALGDMAELGDAAAAEHRALGAYASKLGLDGLVGVGALAAHYAGPGWQTFADGPSAVRHLASSLVAGDRILFKASRSARFEALIEALKAALGAPPC